MNLFGDLEGLQAVARRSLDNSEHRVSRCSGQSGLVAFQHLAHGLSGYPAYVNPVGAHAFQDIRRVKLSPLVRSTALPFLMVSSRRPPLNLISPEDGCASVASVFSMATVFSGTAEVSRTASFLNVPTAAEIFLVR